jgi:hypothetical protein
MQSSQVQVLVVCSSNTSGSLQIQALVIFSSNTSGSLQIQALVIFSFTLGSLKVSPIKTMAKRPLPRGHGTVIYRDPIKKLVVAQN